MALIGIDTGGTFTDFVNLDPSTGSISIVKVIYIVTKTLDV